MDLIIVILIHVHRFSSSNIVIQVALEEFPVWWSNCEIATKKMNTSTQQDQTLAWKIELQMPF